MATKLPAIRPHALVAQQAAQRRLGNAVEILSLVPVKSSGPDMSYYGHADDVDDVHTAPLASPVPFLSVGSYAQPHRSYAQQLARLDTAVMSRAAPPHAPRCLIIPGCFSQLFGNQEKIAKWMKLCEKVRNKNIALEAPIQEEIDQFGEGKACATLAEFEAVYKAGFIEKDNAYEVKMKAKEDQLANERRLRETFGSDSDSEDA
ncbi:hypothetical protein PHYSODRAFT_327474 [Phytophthora sojae]|uniref:Uncharacterized protein n=1 Tax=Phytophthora sojae (strain P6497) TaxID=1094619 RepID=G4Z9Q7_PHYSP|nr:hypothetical protein PHYSODRAFT_327474 [Phytophthora sojae]EGZ19171.1 hypothetical protein PHYSODRAFT_327474 [Phytophthora sojae]|eukprot:XP_009521888.1 hypothetical protein PHYSODRAFT_327474 [Phytophthora sojae]